MLHALARNWWAILLRGIAALVFGLCALFWPGAAGIALVILFGAYALVDGIFALVAAVRAVESHERWMALALEGVVGIAIAAVTYFDLRLTASALFLTIAAWAVLTGILEIVAAIQLRKVLPNDWLLLLGGIASIVFGALMVAFPLAGAVTVIYLIGAYAIVFGVVLIGFGLRLRQHAH
ncbi:MAG: HdeD family acid-resistance protein [bacterium]|nr:HdeD family acid-resistance protein [bacterium]